MHSHTESGSSLDNLLVSFTLLEFLVKATSWVEAQAGTDVCQVRAGKREERIWMLVCVLTTVRGWAYGWPEVTVFP